MSFFSLPEPSDEEKGTIIDNMAKKISEWQLDPIAIILFSMMKPVSLITTHLTLLPLSPFLEAFDIPAYTWVSIFEDEKNVEKLIGRIEAHRDAIEEEKKRERAGKPTFFDTLKKRIGRQG